uniref:M23ase beta-sheet core domain-containing protein n=1 Tax=Prevotella sp. GTC17262 TaxID=3236797 RepID=A0AB33JNA5_9BACT
MHGIDWYDYGARHYDAMLGRWMCMAPSAEKTFPVSGYTYCLNNPVNSVDPDGKRSIPLYNPFNDWYVKIDSWFGYRNTGIKNATSYHKGLDFNYSCGGNNDYGTPILATHEGIATIDNNPSGGEGRFVVITSPNGDFRTRYFHLSEINIKDGQYIKESDNIAKMGGSAYGKDYGRTSHLHYEIQRNQSGKWVSVNPTGGKENEISNIIDPQKWIDNKTYEGGMLPEIIVTRNNSLGHWLDFLLPVKSDEKEEN